MPLHPPQEVWLFFFQAEDGIRDDLVTGVQTCALPILTDRARNRCVQHARAEARRRGGRALGGHHPHHARDAERREAGGYGQTSSLGGDVSPMGGADTSGRPGRYRRTIAVVRRRCRLLQVVPEEQQRDAVAIVVGNASFLAEAVRTEL